MTRLRRIASSLTVLAVGIVVGSALAVAVIAGGPRALIDSVTLLGSLLTGVERIDEPWLLRGEWRIALITGSLIAALCWPVWWMIRRRGSAGYRSASLLGASMTAPFAVAWFHSGYAETFMVDCLGVTAAGALAGAAALAVSRRLAGSLR